MEAFLGHQKEQLIKSCLGVWALHAVFVLPVLKEILSLCFV